MHEKIARIESTMLGIEDHGIMTAMLHVSYGGSGQGIGGYAFDQYEEETGKRAGTAFGTEWIMNVLRVAHVDEWEKLKGKYIIILNEDLDYNSKVLGIKSLPPDGDEIFIFKNLVKKHFPNNV